MTWASIHLGLTAAASARTWADGDEEPAQCLAKLCHIVIGTRYATAAESLERVHPI